MHNSAAHGRDSRLTNNSVGDHKTCVHYRIDSKALVDLQSLIFSMYSKDYIELVACAHS